MSGGAAEYRSSFAYAGCQPHGNFRERMTGQLKRVATGVQPRFSRSKSSLAACGCGKMKEGNAGLDKAGNF